MSTRNNPGLENFELSQYRGTENLDYFSMLPILSDFLQNEISPQHWPQIQDHLTHFGYLVSGELNILINACHKEGKYGKLEKYDRHGNRIDEIIYSPEQIKAKEIAHNAGLVNLDHQKGWNIPFYYYHREALAYLSNLNGEAGYNCPLAMTEGMLDVLTNVATQEQRKRFLPLIINEKLDYYFACGQYLTERVGGNNVGANRTIAIKNKDGNYSLFGEKWFCSNPGEIWVTTAKIEGSNMIGAFIMGRRKQNGELNDHHLLRLKDIIGSRGKVTAEIEFRYAEAELLGKK